MRHIVQFVIPTLIFLVLVYLVAGRHKTSNGGEDAPVISNTTFLLLLVIGASFTVALLFGMAQL